MFGANNKKFTFGGAVKGVANKAIEFANNLEEGKTLGEKIERAITKHINSEPDVAYILNAIKSDLGFPGELEIIPKVNDDTLLVESYNLVTGGQVVQTAKDAKTLVKSLREVILTDDDKKVEAFVKSLDMAYAKVVK